MIKLIVPYPPGGVTDVIGRIVAQELGKQLGQQVIVARLNEALTKIVQSPEAKDALLKQGVYAAPPTAPAKADEQIQSEVLRWRKVISDADIKSDE